MKGKTKVIVKEDSVRTFKNIKNEYVGYIDGYISLDRSPTHAIVVAGSVVQEIPLNRLQVISEEDYKMKNLPQF